MTAFDQTTEVVTIIPPGSDEPVYLRYPSFSEWHGLAKAHRELDGAAPSVELIAKTIATCLADETGKAAKTDHAAIMRASPRRVMWIYRRCWETVLKSDDETVQELEKNSEASRG